MGYLTLHRYEGEDIILSVDPAVSDEELVRQLRGDGIVVHLGRAAFGSARVSITAPHAIHILRAELLLRP